VLGKANSSDFLGGCTRHSVILFNMGEEGSRYAIKLTNAAVERFCFNHY
jgi:hypothetical protein